SYNVAGVIPGTNHELAHEAVIIGGHGDHVGSNSLGHVYPGADDNGSGASVVMELARVFAANPQPRTMIFIIFGAEDQGLLGSVAIAAELPDTYDYITMVNLDMTGRGEGITGIGGGNAIPAVWYDFYSSLSDSMSGQIKANRTWGGFSSDHAWFREAGIPAFTCYSVGSHDHYHTTEDNYATIDTRAIGGCLSSLSLWLETLASHPEPLVDEFQAERVVWHRGYALRWAELSEPELDFNTAIASARNGYSATVLHMYSPTNDVERGLFVETLDHYRDELALNKTLNLGNALGDVTGDAYNLKGTVFMAVEGDDFSSADSTRMDYWNALGLRWIILDNPSSWLSNETVRSDKEGVVQAWKRLDCIVQMPLTDAETWLPLVSELGTSLFVGEWDDFAAVSEETLADLKESGAHLLVTVPNDDLPQAVAMVDQLHDLRVHVQPVGDDYGEALSWVRLTLDTGLEKDQFLDWITRHYGTW
ncbi:MAG TPA: M28 family peptidase, partial [Bacteroidetes bacterium]|nr:M28 family peptidase [Bacteroidota bacterium]HEX04488.1 M28 family peptidase [Bacteroidota bacterium]